MEVFEYAQGTDWNRWAKGLIQGPRQHGLRVLFLLVWIHPKRKFVKSLLMAEFFQTKTSWRTIYKTSKSGAALRGEEAQNLVLRPAPGSAGFPEACPSGKHTYTCASKQVGCPVWWAQLIGSDCTELRSVLTNCLHSAPPQMSPTHCIHTLTNPFWILLLRDGVNFPTSEFWV